MYWNRTAPDARRCTLSRLLRGLQEPVLAETPMIFSSPRPSVPGADYTLFRMVVAVLLIVGTAGCRGGKPSTSGASVDTASAVGAAKGSQFESGWAGRANADSLGAVLPATFAGRRPADAGRVRTVLDLNPDGTYRLTRQQRDSTHSEVGRWHRAADGTRLRLLGPDDPATLAWTDPDTIRAGRSGVEDDASDIALPLVRTSRPVAATATLRLTGEYLYYADAGRFRPCRTGIDMRVAQEEANARLERAYLDARPAPQARVRATVEGRFEQRPRIDNPGREDVLVVERVVRIDPDGRCGPGDETLAGTTWRLVQLGDRLLSPGAPEATLRLTESDSTVAGTGGCNRFGGRYRLDGPTGLSFSGIAATKRLCEEATMRVEEGLLRALHEADRYRVVHQSFELFRGETRLARLQKEGVE